VIKGKDDCDPTSVDFHDNNIKFDPSSDTPLKGITIGIPSEYYVEGLSDEVLNTWSDGINKLEMLGAVIKPVSLPNTANALSAYYIIAPAEAYSNLAKYDGVRYGIHVPRHESDPSFCTSTRTVGFGKEVKRRLMVGAHVLKSQDYLVKAQQVRALVRQDFDIVFNKENLSSGYVPSSADTIDALLTPASMTSAPSLDQVLKKKINPYVNDVFTIPSSLAGLPAIVIPCKKEPLPIGLQLISQYGHDNLLLFIASKLE
jgi:aspartyl-tRNA(Asn)/glutamyl-tRNA(Gln) amidotransferase subunit A